MRKSQALLAILFLFAALFGPALAQDGEALQKIEAALKPDVPKFMCVEKNFATGAQPSNEAFAKLKAHGFRSVLSLRTDNEGIDNAEERAAAEKAGLRFHHIPVAGAPFQPEQVNAFFQTVKDPANQPMLIHCGSANRVAALWAVYRVLDQGWSEEKAFSEAAAIGLTSAGLKKAAEEYIAANRRNAR